MAFLSFERKKKQKSLRDDVHLHEISNVCVVLLIDVESRMQNACAKHDNKHVFYFMMCVSKIDYLKALKITSLLNVKSEQMKD